MQVADKARVGCITRQLTETLPCGCMRIHLESRQYLEHILNAIYIFGSYCSLMQTCFVPDSSLEFVVLVCGV